jgi:hypothetical protein
MHAFNFPQATNQPILMVYEAFINILIFISKNLPLLINLNQYSHTVISNSTVSISWTKIQLLMYTHNTILEYNLYLQYTVIVCSCALSFIHNRCFPVHVQVCPLLSFEVTNSTLEMASTVDGLPVGVIWVAPTCYCHKQLQLICYELHIIMTPRWYHPPSSKCFYTDKFFLFISNGKFI